MSRAPAHLYLAMVVALMCAAGCASSRAVPDGVPHVLSTPDVPRLEGDEAYAYAILRDAARFESPHVGDSGALSVYAAAFRALLHTHDAQRAFRSLFAEATLAGKLYALSGLYFVDSPSFEPAARALAKRGGVVRAMQGCIVLNQEVAEIVFAPEPRIMVPQGKTVTFAMEQEHGKMFDIAGGYVPLRLADDEDRLPAPRAPLSR
jgi:hypothetical protein